MEAREADMQKSSTKTGNETLNMIIAGLVVLAIGAGTATAAISIGPDKDANPAARPLTITRGVTVKPAFGPDDEDCVFATRKVVLAGGRIQIVRHLECAE
jgi:hypothetical protein